MSKSRSKSSVSKKTKNFVYVLLILAVILFVATQLREKFIPDLGEMSDGEIDKLAERGKMSPQLLKAGANVPTPFSSEYKLVDVLEPRMKPVFQDESDDVYDEDIKKL